MSAPAEPLLSIDHAEKVFAVNRRGRLKRETAVVRAVDDVSLTVQRGETLYQIAQRYLGSGSKHPEIYAANRDRIPDPSRLPIGVTLVIPPAR